MSSDASPYFYQSTRRRRNFTRRLLEWYGKHKRNLPWRQRSTLYRVWVSEIMLQQTQVATVIPYYRRFMRRFPSIRKLAEANLQEVLKYWEGLGYYRRARCLHQAARIIREDFHGRFPREYGQVLSLPGIGRYTAGAILSIGDQQQLPILEGNTIRLLARLFAVQDDISRSGTRGQLWKHAERMLPEDRCGDFNQALMELGSQICQAEQPRCGICPVRNYCAARREQLVPLVPFHAAKSPITPLYEDLLLIQAPGRQQPRFVTRECLSGERWQGLFDFPRIMQRPEPSSPSVRRRFVQKLFRATGTGGRCIDPHLVTHLVTRLRHHVTRYKISLDVYGVRLRHRIQLRSSHHSWSSLEELHQLPLTPTARRALHCWQQHAAPRSG